MAKIVTGTLLILAALFFAAAFAALAFILSGCHPMHVRPVPLVGPHVPLCPADMALPVTVSVCDGLFSAAGAPCAVCEQSDCYDAIDAVLCVGTCNDPACGVRP